MNCCDQNNPHFGFIYIAIIAAKNWKYSFHRNNVIKDKIISKKMNLES